MDIGGQSWLTGFQSKLDDYDIEKPISNSTWLLRTSHRHLNEERAVPCWVLPSTQLTGGLSLGSPKHQLGTKLITTVEFPGWVGHDAGGSQVVINPHRVVKIKLPCWEATRTHVENIELSVEHCMKKNNIFGICYPISLGPT
eukprot:6812632-Prorocentrum_lima.AAC.1